MIQKARNKRFGGGRVEGKRERERPDM